MAYLSTIALAWQRCLDSEVAFVTDDNVDTFEEHDCSEDPSHSNHEDFEIGDDLFGTA